MGLAWCWQWPELNVTLLVDTQTATMWRDQRQRWFQHERGGQLFADISKPEGIWLTASPPHPADVAGYRWLEYDASRCHAEVAEANQGGLRLIGYWHTHPQRIPRLSPRDRVSFQKFADCHRDTLPNPIAVIVGTSDTHQGVRVWSIQPSGFTEASYEPPKYFPFALE